MMKFAITACCSGWPPRCAARWTGPHQLKPCRRQGLHGILHQPHSVQIAQALVEEEGTGTRALRRLAAQEKGINDGLDSVLLEMMAMDSEKHAHLLHFVQLRLECPPDLRLADPTIVGWRRNIGLLMSTNGPRRSSVGDGQGASRPFCACSQSASATMITPRTK